MYLEDITSWVELYLDNLIEIDNTGFSGENYGKNPRLGINCHKESGIDWETKIMELQEREIF